MKDVKISTATIQWAPRQHPNGLRGNRLTVIVTLKVKACENLFPKKKLFGHMACDDSGRLLCQLLLLCQCVVKSVIAVEHASLLCILNISHIH